VLGPLVDARAGRVRGWREDGAVESSQDVEGSRERSGAIRRREDEDLEGSRQLEGSRERSCACRRREDADDIAEAVDVKDALPASALKDVSSSGTTPTVGGAERSGRVRTEVRLGGCTASHSFAPRRTWSARSSGRVLA
jgi:hypothetical protein